MANAADKDGVTSSRSFPKVNQTKKDLLAESTSVSVESSSKWSLGTMSVPKTTSTASASASATATTVSASSSAVVSYANQFVGISPYVYGGTSPTTGWDCSGFTQYVFAHFGISLPRTSGAQASVGTAVASLADAQPGDLIANSTHVGIYAGGGMVVNALKPSVGTAYSSVATSFTGGYSIRRVL